MSGDIIVHYKLGLSTSASLLLTSSPRGQRSSPAAAAGPRNHKQAERLRSTAEPSSGAPVVLTAPVDSEVLPPLTGSGHAGKCT